MGAGDGGSPARGPRCRPGRLRRANSWAEARPRPEPPPVISATLPASRLTGRVPARGRRVRNAARRPAGRGCRGLAGRRTRRGCGPASTTWPFCSTTRSSHIIRTTFRSWLTNNRAIPSSRRSRSSSCRMVAWIETSSAAVGSSSTSRRGRGAMARAMPTRAFCPPESWCGKRPSRSGGSPARSAASRTRWSRAAPSFRCSRRRSGWAMLSKAGWRGFRLSCGSWNTICTARRRGERWKSRAGMAPIGSPPSRIVPAVRVEQAGDQAGERALAGAALADEAEAAAGRDGERHVAHGVDRAREGLDEVADGEQRRPSSPSEGEGLGRRGALRTGAGVARIRPATMHRTRCACGPLPPAPSRKGSGEEVG